MQWWGSVEPTFEDPSDCLETFVQVRRLGTFLSRLFYIFHLRVDLPPEKFVVVLFGVNGFLHLKEVLLDGLNFLIDLELDGPLLQDPILEILDLMLVYGKIALFLRERRGDIFLRLHLLQLLLLLQQTDQTTDHSELRLVVNVHCLYSIHFQVQVMLVILVGWALQLPCIFHLLSKPI